MPAQDRNGTEAVTRVLLDLLNDYPGLAQGQTIKFSMLNDASGIGFFPTSGARFLSDREDITGHVAQVCMFPFDVVYRLAPRDEEHRINAKEFLDNLGRWLERQPVMIGSSEVQLSGYPDINQGNRKIQAITCTTPTYVNNVYPDGIEDWIIKLQLKYTNTFNR